jgi:hypothetical protein
MNPFKMIVYGICLAVLSAIPALSQHSAPPRLKKQGTATQLIVGGKPFLVLAGELSNSSASSLSYMEPLWARLEAGKLNTVLAPVSWELTEPQEGKFDFTLVDGLIAAARRHNLKLVFLWFGSWKNTYSSYVPEWVKRDTKRFPRTLLKDGRPTERLTPLSAANREADAKAYAALMKRIRATDADHTVLMMQVENEIGVIPESRDFSPAADSAFHSPVPAQLMDYILANADRLEPELRRAWVDAGRRTGGSWKEVFGPAPIVDDFFMAWHYAAYVDALCKAGKAAYDIPMFTNAALIRPNYLPGQYNSGGPLPHSMDIYRAAGPHIDFLSPDIYFSNFAYWAGRYDREGNPLFVPETYGGASGAANAYYAFGRLNAIGFSPFGIDRSLPAPGEAETDLPPLAAAYSVLARLAPKILGKQGSKQLSAILLEGSEQRSGRISFGGYDVSVNWANAPGAADPNRRVGILFIQEADDEFLVAGSGSATLSFAPDSGAQIAGIASIDEEVEVGGQWIWQRRLNGDENGQGQVLRLGSGAAIYKIRLYRY